MALRALWRLFGLFNIVKKISISIVTYNSEHIIGACLASLAAHFEHRGYEKTIQLIDNQSQDGTVAILRHFAEQNPQFQVIQNACNAGFGRGHNVAIGQADSDYHIICNPDIVINGQTITALADYMGQHPDIAILCPRLTNADGSLQPNNHKLPTLLDLVLRRIAPAWLQRRLQQRMDAYIMLDVGYENICDVPFVSGAFMFCRTAVLKQVGGFDGRYFLYFEDADLCRKIHGAGYRTVYYPDASVVHLWERAAHKSWRMAWVMSVSALKYFNKWGYRLY